MEKETKYCKHCGEIIDSECVICPKCGKQVEKLTDASPTPVVINNSNSATSNPTIVINSGQPKNKWVALLLCIFTVCGHKFYEGKIGMGVIYLLTFGLFGIGWIIDIISIAFKPTTYYV